jgi:hypothetical protein
MAAIAEKKTEQAPIPQLAYHPKVKAAAAHVARVSSDATKESERREKKIAERTTLRLELDDKRRAWIKGSGSEKAVNETQAKIDELDLELSRWPGPEVIRARVAEAERDFEHVQDEAMVELSPEWRRIHRETVEALAKVLIQASVLNRRLIDVTTAVGGRVNLAGYGWPELTFSDAPAHPDSYSKLSQFVREARAAGYTV